METSNQDKTGKLNYKSDVKPTWCPGCGDFGVLSSLYKALEYLAIPQKDTVMVSGIGCSSRLPYFVNTYGVHGIHGRALPIATGIKLSRPDLNVITVGGDGDGFSIGGGHFMHAVRRNVNITYIIMNNSIYGLTKGQVSPTSNSAFVTKSTPYGNVEEPINPVGLAIAYGASFVAKGFSPRLKELTEVFIKAIQHKGFSFVDVMSPCPTFNKVDTAQHYQNIATPIPEDHDTKDKIKSLDLAYRKDKLYCGIYYENPKETIDERLLKFKKNDFNKEEQVDALLADFG